MEDVKAKQEKEKEEKEKQKAEENLKEKVKSPIKTEEDEGSDNDVLKDLNLKDLPLPGDLLDTDLVNTIMAEDDIKVSRHQKNLYTITHKTILFIFKITRLFSLGSR